MKSKFKKFCFVMITTLLCFTMTMIVSAKTDSSEWSNFAAESFAGGSGTKQDPYLISSAEELALLAKLVNDGDETYNGAYYQQSSNIDLSEHSWKPIGCRVDRAFYGNYDGNGFAITNMNISDIHSMYIGLFGVNGGSVRKISLKNANIIVTESDNKTGVLYAGLVCGAVIGSSDGDASINYCEISNGTISITCQCHVLSGAICGYTYGATVDNVLSESVISIDTGMSSISVGGAIGAVSSDSTISLIYAETQMQAQNDSSRCEERYHMLHAAGGLFGFVGYDSSNIMLESREMGYIYTSLMFTPSNISIANCNAVGTINSVHIADRGYYCGQVMGMIGPISGSVYIADIFTEVYLTLSGGNSINDTNNTGGAGHRVYDQFDAIADSFYVHNLISKDFSSPGFSSPNAETGYYEDHRSVDGYIYSVALPNNASSWERGSICRTNENTYSCFTFSTGTFDITTNNFTKDVLHLSDEYWEDVGPNSTRLSIKVRSDCFMHNFIEDNSVEATCTNDGTTTYICNTCGETYTETFEAKGHNFNGALCSVCGFDRIEDCNCNCHKTGIAAFIFRLINFFNKIFKINQECACGINHF